jgi:ribosomal protein S21
MHRDDASSVERGGLVVAPLPGEPVANALQRFRKLVHKSGVLHDRRLHEAFRSTAERRRLKRRSAEARRRRDARRATRRRRDRKP